LAEYNAWEAGTLIQDAMPQLSADQREFIMTGCTSEEWDLEFGQNTEKDDVDFKGQA